MSVTKQTVAFVAFQDQPNLGIGYLGSVLVKAGYHVQVLDFQLPEKELLETLLASKPLMVGFAVIFQYHIEKFSTLLEYLRTNGVNCHFTCGGHFPSLRPTELFAAVPAMDSIVLFEGEKTCLELVQTIERDEDWRPVHGIAYQDKALVTTNPLRPLEEDLDIYPPPLRPPLKELIPGKKYATIIAGRGCIYDCSFCSIRRFYTKPPGPIKRVRRPEMVVREMELLYQNLGCSVFMFQDDDFPVAQPHGPEWAREFCQLLREKELHLKVNWKISCRPDEIDGDLFYEMKQCGLFLVYLGIESGIDEGLKFMNKKVNRDTLLTSVATLKELGLIFDYGFMLFDPTTTMDKVNRNLDFLEMIIGDGSAPLNFGKMRPYAETRIETELKKSGRLTGRKGFEDYTFLDEPVNQLYHTTIDLLQDWIGSPTGVSNAAKWIRYCQYLSPLKAEQTGFAAKTRKKAAATIAESNQFALSLIRDLCNSVADGKLPTDEIERLKLKSHRAQSHYGSKLLSMLDELQASLR